MHLKITLFLALLNVFEGFSDHSLIFVLEMRFLTLIPDLHEVCVRPDMRFLLLFVAIDPDLTRVLLCSDQFLLLVQFVK